jgi:hypothetical protein
LRAVFFVDRLFDAVFFFALLAMLSLAPLTIHARSLRAVYGADDTRNSQFCTRENAIFQGRIASARSQRTRSSQYGTGRPPSISE